jgi:hypothetical protein
MYLLGFDSEQSHYRTRLAITRGLPSDSIVMVSVLR